MGQIDCDIVSIRGDNCPFSEPINLDTTEVLF